MEAPQLGRNKPYSAGQTQCALVFIQRNPCLAAEIFAALIACRIPARNENLKIGCLFH